MTTPDLNEQWQEGGVPADPFQDDVGDTYEPPPESSPIPRASTANGSGFDWKAIVEASGLEQLHERPKLSDIAACLQRLRDGARGCDSPTRALVERAAIDALKSRKTQGASDLVRAHLRETRALADGQGGASLVADAQCWPDPVNGAQLLNDLSRSVAQYIVLPRGAATAISLWVLHTHAIDAALISPRLAIMSPTKRCGKSLLLEWLSEVVRRPLHTENASAATVFRVIEASMPTLLLDEVDRYLSNRDELIGILNSGHKRGGSVLRCVGENNEVRAFQVFGALAFGGIGRPRGADTLMDRSIHVRLVRKRKEDKVERFRRKQRAALGVLQRQASRWATDNVEALRLAEPVVPDALNDRQADGWEGLIAIADIVGGRWPEQAREAATLLSKADDDDGSLREQLLSDIHEYFRSEGVDRVSSKVLAAWLAELEGRPWAEMGMQAKPITPNKIARRLREFDVRPRSVRIPLGATKTCKGYQIEWLKDAFERYLPPTKPEQPEHTEND